MTGKRLLIISPDTGLTSALQQKLAAASWPEVAVEHSYPSPGQMGRLVHERRPSIVLIGLSEPDYALRLIEDMHATYPGILVAATHSVNVPDLIMSAIRSGAAEYLGPPFEVQFAKSCNVLVLPDPANALILSEPPLRNASTTCTCSGVGEKPTGISAPRVRKLLLGGTSTSTSFVALFVRSPP